MAMQHRQAVKDIVCGLPTIGCHALSYPYLFARYPAPVHRALKRAALLGQPFLFLAVRYYSLLNLRTTISPSITILTMYVPLCKPAASTGSRFWPCTRFTVLLMSNLPLASITNN
jgi:hypothetical protein